jgi:membrane protein implicated in regulation of membrane protease activity
MNNFPQLALTFLGLLFCVGDVAILGFLLTWHERAASPAERRFRLLRGVLPAAVVLVALLLLAFVQIMLLWSGQ